MDRDMTLEEAFGMLDLAGGCTDVLARAGTYVGAAREGQNVLTVIPILRDSLPKLPAHRRAWLIRLGLDLAHAAGEAKK